MIDGRSTHLSHDGDDDDDDDFDDMMIGGTEEGKEGSNCDDIC